MRKILILAVAAMALAMAVAGTASASVTFDAATGSGFVGKGDVQTPFSWNDQALQKNAGGVTFKYNKTTAEDYAITCEWDTSSTQGRDHEVVIKHHVANQSADVAAAVAYDVKPGQRLNPNNKVTGFNLLERQNVANTGSGDAIPAVGDACLGNGEGTINPTVTSVELLSSTVDEKLTANYGGTGHVIWPPVIA